LRKCLILSFDLKNETLKAWVEGELNGFGKDDELPQYRRVMLHSRGNFSGPAGAWIPKRPLPLGVLETKDRDFLVPTRLSQPIAAYDQSEARKQNNATIAWPPDLIVKYQEKFIEGYALSHAWQDLPASVLVGLCEEVRNRVLRFDLEIRDELGQFEDKPSAIPAERIEAAVVNYIYGGVNVIGGTVRDFTQIGNVVVPRGDLNALTAALKRLDVGDAEIVLLEQAIGDDRKSGAAGLGQRTKNWLAA
jgi:AbiTii